MDNGMMIAALQKQRQGKMDNASPQAPSPENSGVDLAARIEALEQKYEELCKTLGIHQEQEVKEPVKAGY